jgi:hypothetical protein
MIVALGLFLRQPSWIALASVIVGCGQVISDFRRPEALGAATLWGAGMALTGIADGAAILLGGDRFALYSVEDYFAEALAITFVGGSAILLGFEVASRPGKLRSTLPPVTVGAAPRLLRSAVIVAGVVILAMRYLSVDVGSGTPSQVFYSAIPLIVFALARDACRRNSSEWLWASAALAYAEVIRAVLFEYLRGQMLLPVVALALGCAVGSRDIKAVRRVQLFPMYVFVVIFVMFFETFGAHRADLGSGLERIQELTSRRESSESAATILARLTSLNQVSQVVRLTKDEGFEHGRTLEYFGYVFAPRFLWPSKPTIAQGQWFAERLGQGVSRADAGFSNSINMTIAGECYLNFGWPGVFVGCLLAGVWIGILWNAARFWSSDADLLIGIYAFYMLLFTWNMNIDLQTLPTAFAVYLLFWALSRAIRLILAVGGVTSVSRRTPMTALRPTMLARSSARP